MSDFTQRAANILLIILALSGCVWPALYFAQNEMLKSQVIQLSNQVRQYEMAINQFNQQQARAQQGAPQATE